jgi:predicted NBD/HSP70 family sugar kinase
MAGDMAKAKEATKAKGPTLPTHGAAILPSVEVVSYNVELEDEEGFVGDKASKGAFRGFLEDVRKALRVSGEDPLGDKETKEISKKKLDALLGTGDAEAAAVVQSAIEDFSQQLASVIRRFLRLKAWQDTQCIVVGGGFRASRVGELAIARTAILLKKEELAIDLQPIHNDPDEAGLIGAAHLLPAWMLNGHEAMLAVDVGGSNIRAGLVELKLGKAKDLSKAHVMAMDLWCHKEEDGVDREAAVDELIRMLRGLIDKAEKHGLGLAPVIGIGCPGLIEEDGSITRGAQNLPGNWESSRFNLPHAIREKIPHIGDHETMVVMHNDAVVQGLSELPHVDSGDWAVLTIGTGLGNARFSTKEKRKRKR